MLFNYNKEWERGVLNIKYKNLFTPFSLLYTHAHTHIDRVYIHEHTHVRSSFAWYSSARSDYSTLVYVDTLNSTRVSDQIFICVNFWLWSGLVLYLWYLNDDYNRKERRKKPTLFFVRIIHIKLHPCLIISDDKRYSINKFFGEYWWKMKIFWVDMRNNPSTPLLTVPVKLLVRKIKH